eukprot:Skav225669  [mRNA]  locus=scaffold1924:196301:202176:+ [translate_table: standard]
MVVLFFLLLSLTEKQVLDVRTPLLQIAPASLKEFYIFNFEEVEMAVDSFPQVRCINYSRADAASELIVQWEYLLLNTTTCMEEVPQTSMEISWNASNASHNMNDSNDSSSWNASNESNGNISVWIARPCVESIWIPFENTSFRDQNRRPGSVRLSAFSFQPSSSHKFRAVATSQGIAAVLGPVVVEPENSTDGMTLYAAGDAEQIINSVDVLLASPDVDWDGRSPTASLLTALEALKISPFERICESCEAWLLLLTVATGILDPRPEALEKMTQILVATVDAESSQSDLQSDLQSDSLNRAADLLENLCQMALESPEAGVESTVATAMLEAVSTFNEGGRRRSPSETESEPGALLESTKYTEKMERLASKVATAAHAKLSVGESKFLSGALNTLSRPQGVNLQLISSSTFALSSSGLTSDRLFMPPNPFPSRETFPSRESSRRLQAQSCGNVAITATYWLRSNPYTWASGSKGMNQYVSTDATVGVLEFDMCGLPLSFNETILERTLRLGRIALPARRAPPRGFEWDVACARLWHVPEIRWSEMEQAWIMNGVEVQRPVYWDDVEVSCVIYEADGNGTSFTAFFFPVELSTTTTTVEWTYPTYTTFEIPPLPPVYVISCNESLLPEPPEKDKTWNCTKPGEGQECRAICRGFPDQMTSVTCLKGQSSLEWFVTNVCPVFTTTTLDMTIDTPADNAILSTVLVFVFILIFLCSAGIFALMAYGLYKFTMNESKSRISSVKISPEVEIAIASASDTVGPL